MTARLVMAVVDDDGTRCVLVCPNSGAESQPLMYVKGAYEGDVDVMGQLTTLIGQPLPEINSITVVEFEEMTGITINQVADPAPVTVPPLGSPEWELVPLTEPAEEVVHAGN